MDMTKTIHSYPPVDFKTLPVDCRNFVALTAALLCRICCGKKTLRTNFSDHEGKNVWPKPHTIVRWVRRHVVSSVATKFQGKRNTLQDN